MALAGLSIGDGRAANERPAGQLGVVCRLAMIALCWFWAGRLLNFGTLKLACWIAALCVTI